MSDGDVTCWHCHAVVHQSALVCESCQALQPPRDQDPFARLGLAVCVQVDDVTLQEAYRTRLLACHPDRFRSASSREQRYAEQHAQEISRAYRKLDTFVGRAQEALAILAPDQPQDQAMDATTTQKVFELMEHASTDPEAQTAISERAQHVCLQLGEAIDSGHYSRAIQHLQLLRALHRSGAFMMQERSHDVTANR